MQMPDTAREAAIAAGYILPPFRRFTRHTKLVVRAWAEGSGRWKAHFDASGNELCELLFITGSHGGHMITPAEEDGAVMMEKMTSDPWVSTKPATLFPAMLDALAHLIAAHDG